MRTTGKNQKKSISTELNEVVENHLFAVISSSVFTVGAVVGTAIWFYWTTQIQIISEVSANKALSESNQSLSAEIRGHLTDISSAVGDIHTDVAIIREKVTGLEGDVARIEGKP